MQKFEFEMRGLMIKVLWFVNGLFPAVKLRLGKKLDSGSGFWMNELYKNLQSDNSFQIAIASSSSEYKSEMQFSIDDTIYYCLPESKYVRYGLKTQPLIKKWLKIIEEFNPDLIEFHGTEKYYGLLAKHTKVPTLVDIQGVLNQCAKKYYGSLSLFSRLKHSSLHKMYLSYVARTRIEYKVFKANSFFVGRTDWDHRQLVLLNPTSTYFSCPRILQNAFQLNEWKLNETDSKPIFVSTANAKPLKGCDILIRAASILKDKQYDFSIIFVGEIPNSGFGKYLRNLVTSLGLSKIISFVGFSTPKSMIDLYLTARAFILPSFMDNSPNALAEAMCLGIPCIASSAGGIPSMLKNNSNGMLFNPGDYEALACLIENSIIDKEHFAKYGSIARKQYLEKHSASIVTNQMIDIYRAVISEYSR